MKVTYCDCCKKKFTPDDNLTHATVGLSFYSMTDQRLKEQVSDLCNHCFKEFSAMLEKLKKKVSS